MDKNKKEFGINCDTLMLLSSLESVVALLFITKAGAANKTAGLIFGGLAADDGYSLLKCHKLPACNAEFSNNIHNVGKSCRI